MARKAAREAAMSLLYQKIFSEDYDIAKLEDMSEELVLDDQDTPYIEDILHGCQEHQQEIDELIQMNSKGWKFDRISKVDLSILRLALYEILYRSDIPDSVSVNEAVELGKKYGGDKSGSFINGILGTFLRSRDSSPENQA
jgi:N utilization substance protein B